MAASRIRVLFLMAADALCMAVVWAVVVNAYKWIGCGNYHASDYWNVWPAIAAFVLTNALFRLYHGNPLYPSLPLAPVEEFRRLVCSAFGVHLLIIAFLGFRREVELVSRVVLLVSAVGVALFAQPVRDLFRFALKRLDVCQIPAFLVGEGATGDVVARRLAGSSYFGIRIVRRFSRGQLREIVPAATAAGVHHLFCCYRDDRYFKSQMPEFVKWFLFVEYMPTAMAFPVANAQAVQIGGLGGLEMVNSRRMKFLAFEKAAVDWTLALVLLFVSLPLFGLVPLLIKLTSKGPVFYKAHRLGRHGRPIRVLKFRSMYEDADRRLRRLLEADEALREEFAGKFKLRRDPRVTPLGRFLRKTSIDELPQLVNVLARDMALIGPRPIVESEIAYYGKSYEIFSAVKPGITGLWQVSGRSDCGYDERVALDVHYILNWTPWMDLWIVIRTAVSVLKMSGSY